MQLNLKRIAPLQAGKMLAAFYGLLSLLFLPFMLLFMTVGNLAARQQGQSVPPLPLLFGLGVGFMIFLPVLYAAVGFVFGALSAWLYNWLSKWIGGFEFEFAPKEPPVVPPA